MTGFVLVRHGETDWNLQQRLQGSRDIPLNKTGLAQARALGAALQDQQWDAVVSSPLKRAFETALQISESLGVRAEGIIVDSRLRERHYGDAEGHSLAERRERWPDDIWPNAETPEMMDARTLPTMLEMAETYRGKRVVVVAHGAWIRSVLRVSSGHDPAIIDMHIPNASCTFISHDADGWHLGEIGNAEHVPIFY